MNLRLMLLLVSALCLFGCALAATTVAAPTTSKPSGFASRSIESNDREDVFESQAQTHLAYRQPQHQQQQQPQQQQLQQRPYYDYSQSEEDQEEAPRQIYNNRNIKQQQNFLKLSNNKKPSSEETEEEEEIEEPDRLSTLLAKSNFNCNTKKSGYYADESLNCEVFHYCQDNQRHSWICPEGFSFHQVHLICMPPSHDNICQQSSMFHVVNDYLYKPINLQEHQSKPNVTLRYSERYYPENYYEHERYDDEEEDETPAPRTRVQPQRQQVQIGYQQQSAQYQQLRAQAQAQALSQPQPAQPQQQQQQQITLVRHQPAPQQPPTTIAYRKPLPATTVPPQLQFHQLQPQRAQLITPAATPSPYRFFTAAPQLQQYHPSQQQVFRTPEEINISLQQRRPQVFIATSTPRYFDEDYLYERRK